MLLAIALTAMAAHAQFDGTYHSTWSTIDGGGGSCSGGGYSLSGTVGQSDAGSMSGGAFALMGGFWSAADAAPRPALRIVRSGAVVILAWPASLTGFQVQATANLIHPAWRDVNTSPLEVNDESWVVMPASANAQFFRLRKQ